MKIIFTILIALNLSLPCLLNAQSNNDEPKMSHSHIPIAVPTEVLAPALSLDIYPDTMSGYNLILQLDNYQMSAPPRQASMSELMSATINKKTGYIEGHAHLYINGTKIQRVYGKQIHLKGSLFTSGLNQITVTLNNHGHMFWTIKETQVLATLFFNNDGLPSIIHRFDSFPKKS